MMREPVLVPPEPGVFALVNRKRRFAYVSWTKNLQKRSHSMSHMLLANDDVRSRTPKKDLPYWPIKDLPKHDSDEFTFIVHGAGYVADPHLQVARVQKDYLDKSYRLIDGHRAATFQIELGGRTMTLAEALRQHPGVDYLTAYRRLQRGWTSAQALGLAPPDPRWHFDKQGERRSRSSERAKNREMPA